MADLYPDADISSIEDGITSASVNSHGAWPAGFCISIWAIIFIVGIKSGFDKSITFTWASTIYAIVAWLFVWGEWLNWMFGMAGILMVGIGVMWIRVERASPNLN